jgi:hypothetical protein
LARPETNDHACAVALAEQVAALPEGQRLREASRLLRLTTLLRLSDSPGRDLHRSERGAWDELLSRVIAWRQGEGESSEARALADALALDTTTVGAGDNGNLSAIGSILDPALARSAAPEALDWDRARRRLAGAAPGAPTLLEALLGARTRRRKRGTFHTPSEVSRDLARMLHAQAATRGENTRGLVIDPAVGGGALLLAWLDQELQDHAPIDRARGTAQLLRERIRAFDRDPLAVEATRCALLERGFPWLHPGDEALGAVAAIDAMAEPTPAPLRDALGDASALLINPPWASFSGRERQDGAGAARPSTAGNDEGWPALHTRFVGRCLELAPEGVYAGLVLPGQVAGLKGYGAFRARHAERVRAVRPLGEGVFHGVTSETLLMVLGPATMSVLEILGDDSSARIPRRALREQPTRPWTPEPPDAKPGWPPPGFRLEPKAFGDRGIHSGNAAKRLFAKAPREGDVPVLVGADLRAFGQPTPSLWMDPEATPGPQEYFRIGDKVRMVGAPLLLRQTADRPIACRNPGYVFRNSVLAGFGVPGLPLEVCLAILNSEAAARIHRALAFDARQRSFPQVKISQLARFPWPSALIDASLEDALVHGTRALEAAFAKLDDPDDPLRQDAISSPRADMEPLIEGLYGPVLEML